MVHGNVFVFPKSYIKYIFMLAEILAVLPYHSLHKKTALSSLCHKLYSVCILVVILVLTITTCVQSPYTFGTELSTTLPTVNIIYYMSEIIIIIWTVLFINLFGSEKMRKLFLIWYEIDEKLCKLDVRIINDREIIIKIFILWLYALVCFIYDIGWCAESFCKFLFAEHMRRCYVQTLLGVIYGFLHHIYVRFTKVDACLSQILKGKYPISYAKIETVQKVKKETNLKKRIFRTEYLKLKYIILIYTELSEMMDAINHIFGWLLFFIAINIHATVLSSINYILISTNFDYHLLSSSSIILTVAGWLCIEMVST